MSPLWKSKRSEALAHYGCKCNRCGEYGNDVHHKTYQRVGGFELMDDLEILCRDCHKAHHRAQAHSVQRSRGAINRQAIFRFLSEAQKTKICSMFSIHQPDLYLKILNDRFYAYRCAEMLGYSRFYDVTRSGKPEQSRHQFSGSHPYRGLANNYTKSISPRLKDIRRARKNG
jgi:phage terminase large subunit GpA-like protein